MKLYITNLALESADDRSINFEYDIFTQTIGRGSNRTEVTFPASSSDVNVQIRNDVVLWAQQAWSVTVDPADIIIFGSIDITHEMVATQDSLKADIVAASAQVAALTPPITAADIAAPAITTPQANPAQKPPAI